jgi:hypothetical protein
MAVIAIAINKGWNSTEALQYAKEHDLTFLGTPSMVDWVTGMYYNKCANQVYIAACIAVIVSALLLCALCGVMHHHYVSMHVCTCWHVTLHTCATTLCT